MRFVEVNRARPFALLLHYREPHLPYGPMPEEDMAPFKGRDLTVPQHVGVKTEQVKQFTRAYYAAVHAVDRNVGRLLAKLDELGLAGDTIVVFTSDNGYMIGQHALHTKGNAWWLLAGIPPNTNRPNMFEESIRVPLLVRWPGAIPAGTETTEPFSSIDTFATVLGLMGLPRPPEVKQEGSDYSPLLRGQKIPWRDAMFAQYDLRSGALPVNAKVQEGLVFARVTPATMGPPQPTTAIAGFEFAEGSARTIEGGNSREAPRALAPATMFFSHHRWLDRFVISSGVGIFTPYWPGLYSTKRPPWPKSEILFHIFRFPLSEDSWIIRVCLTTGSAYEHSWY